MITFNLSVSSLNLYLSSQLLFYYRYIAKESPDTKITQAYSLGGQVVHKVLEHYAKDRTHDVEAEFELEWERNSISKLRGFNGRFLNKVDYQKAVIRGKFLLDTKYKDCLGFEEEVFYDLIKDDYFSIGVKGFIDLVSKGPMGLPIPVDWKTSSSEGEWDLGALMYQYLYWKKHGVFCEKMIYEYLKIGTSHDYSYPKEKIIGFENVLRLYAEEIMSKGNDISKYSLGNCLSDVFNEHMQKCLLENERRIQETEIGAKIYKNKLLFTRPIKNKVLVKAIDIKYSYVVTGHEFSEFYQSGKWDGKKRMFSFTRDEKGEINSIKNMPLGLLNDFSKLVSDYNSKLNKDLRLVIEDKRDKTIVERKFNIDYKPSEYVFRKHQVEAVDTALSKKITIINACTSSGKTAIAAELIRKTKGFTLYVVNRIDLVKQTAIEFEKDLAVEVGRMVEGEIDISHPVVIASPQTILAILKREDEDSKKLKDYLFNVNVLIWDECHGVKKSSAYGKVALMCCNCKYMIGLTGTAFRSDGSTLEMNALLGMPDFKYTTQQLIADGFGTPTKVFFLSNSVGVTRRNYVDHFNDTGKRMDYKDAYLKSISNNTYRNSLGVSVAKRFLDKNKKVIILVRRIKHGELIQQLIPGSMLINGSVSGKERDSILKCFKENTGLCLVASTAIMSTGINIPSLDAIINLTAHKSGVDSVQIIGRVLRLYEGKEFGYFIDFFDKLKFFDKAAEERRFILEKQGHIIKDVFNIDEIFFSSAKTVYSGVNFT